MSETSFYFFVGENTYLLSREVLRWKQSFRDKHGPENFVEYEGGKCSTSELIDAVSTMPFIAEKRLVLIRGIPKIEREELQAILDNMHPQTVLLIVEPKPDKRFGITKDIEKSAEVKSFPLLSRNDLLTWIRECVQADGSSISPEACNELIDVVGDDQWILESEMRKLCLYVGQSAITPESIDTLCVPSGSQVVWKLTDLIGARKTDEALAFLRHRLERGEDPYGIWVILLNMMKNITLVFAAVSDGLRDERSVATATGLHFLSVRGLLPLSRTLQKKDIQRLVDWAASMDIALKTGGIHYTAERTTEVVALSERAILLLSTSR